MQLIVLGMHRSGTSVLARLLNLMGVYFGPEGMSTGANEENPKGFWERRDVRHLNDLVLHSMGCDWNRLSTFDLARIPDSVRAEFRSTARKLVLEIDAHRPWMIKEPRLSLLLPLWQEALEVPVCIRILRNPVEVAASLLTRNQIPIPDGLLLWEVYVRSGLAASERWPTVTVSHRRLMEAPVAEVQSLFTALQALGVPGLRLPTTREVESFIQADLYRERDSRGDLLEYEAAPQVKAFRQLEAGQPWPGGASKGLKEAQARLAAYETSLPPLSAKLLAELKEREEKCGILSRTLQAERDKLARVVPLEAELAQAREANVALGAQLAEQQASNLSLRQQLSERSAAASALEAELAATTAKMSASISDLEARLRKSGQAEAELKKRLEAGEASLVEAARVRAELADALESHRQHLAREQATVAEGLAALAENRAVIDDLRHRLDAAADEIQVWREASIDREAILHAVRADLAAAQEKLRSSHEEVGKLTRFLLASEHAAEQGVAASKSRELAAEAERGQLELLLQQRDEMIDSLEGRLASTRAELRHGQSQLEQSRSELLRVLGAKTWRMTRPLRVAARLVGGWFGPQRKPPDDRELILASGWFDPDWYLAQYPDVAASGMDPAEHYLQHGWAESRLPCPSFDTDFYLRSNADVASSGVNPLVHFVRHGKGENRTPRDHVQEQ